MIVGALEHRDRTYFRWIAGGPEAGGIRLERVAPGRETAQLANMLFLLHEVLTQAARLKGRERAIEAAMRAACAGRLDVLINNAGVMMESTVEAMPLEDWERTMAVNVTTPFMLIKAALPHLRKVQGSIVNIGSIEGLGSNPQHAAYCASKAELHGKTRAMAVDHSAEGIRCNAVAPGWIDTEFDIAFVEKMPDPARFRQQIRKIHPIGRTGRPEEVAALVHWLASTEASFVTSQVRTVDGARMSKLSLPL